MRKVGRTIGTAFAHGRKAKSGNTTTDGQSVYLHGNAIVKRVGLDIFISLAGWPSNTTRSRIDDVLSCVGVDACVCQQNFKQILRRRQTVNGCSTYTQHPMPSDGWVKV